MSHTKEYKNTFFHYNSDLSGEITIEDKDTQAVIFVSGKNLLDFIAEHVRRERIDKLELMTANEILGIGEKKDERNNM